MLSLPGAPERSGRPVVAHGGSRLGPRRPRSRDRGPRRSARPAMRREVRLARLRESGIIYIKRPARPAIPSPGRRSPPMSDEPRDDHDDDPSLRARARPLAPRSEAREPAGGGGLVRYDPLRAYMAEVARHPLLSREEEHELAVRYRETGDVDAAYQLVASNLRLVVKIAHEYRRTAFQLLDLVQEGNLGLMQAVKKYDPWKGVKLSSYAAWWIRAYIIRFIMENWRMVKLGTTQAQRKLFFNLVQGAREAARPRDRADAAPPREEPRRRGEGRRGDGGAHGRRRRLARRAAVRRRRRLAPDAGSTASPAADAAAADERIGDEQLRRIFREKLDAFSRTITDEKERFIFEQAAPAARRRAAAHAAGGGRPVQAHPRAGAADRGEAHRRACATGSGRRSRTSSCWGRRRARRPGGAAPAIPATSAKPRSAAGRPASSRASGARRRKLARRPEREQEPAGERREGRGDEPREREPEQPRDERARRGRPTAARPASGTADPERGRPGAPPPRTGTRAGTSAPPSAPRRGEDRGGRRARRRRGARRAERAARPPRARRPPRAPRRRGRGGGAPPP